MPVVSFNHYNLRASRDMLEQLRDFYVNVLGLQVGERPPFASFGYWLYLGEQAILHLSSARVDEIRSSHVQNTFDHVALTCTALTEMEAHLQALGVNYRISTVPLLGQTQLFLQDPAGNGIELNFATEAKA